MSFDVNVLSSKPVIKAAANMQNDGGAGNLGYMSQGRQDNEEKKEEISLFASKPEIDTFTASGKIELEDSIETFDLIKWLSNLFFEILKRFK